MSTVFVPNRRLSQGDLNLIVRDERGMMYDPYLITYSIFHKVGRDASAPNFPGIDVPPPQSSDSEQKVLVYGPNAQPNCAGAGLYWVDIEIPSGWQGEYELVWYLNRDDQAPVERVYEEFNVVTMNIQKTSHEAPSIGLAKNPSLTPKIANLVMQVRELLSDENPDRNYHFRPPTAGRAIAGYSQRVGFIWIDKTIIRMLNLSVAYLNTINPQVMYNYTLQNVPDSWAQACCVGAAAHCLSKEAARWAADEFSYSLNGVSLDINKAQTYQGLAGSYMEEFKEWAVPIAATKPHSVGLRQSHFLI
jgi:hypothetical protein